MPQAVGSRDQHCPGAGSSTVGTGSGGSARTDAELTDGYPDAAVGPVKFLAILFCQRGRHSAAGTAAARSKLLLSSLLPL